MKVVGYDGYVLANKDTTLSNTLGMLPHASNDLLPNQIRAATVLSRNMPGLDLLRGLAILAVIFYHGFAYIAPAVPWHNKFAEGLFDITGMGWTGVNLFFTLSGFLITGNLIYSEGKPNYYSRFYIRRALRILPAYLLVLCILGLTRMVSLNYLFLCAIFLANWPTLFLHGPIVLYPVFWSLAVEEQFYLVWPWLSRRLRSKGLLALCVAIILLCPMFRGIGLALALGDVFSKTFMIGDNLAIGAVIAILCRFELSLMALVRIGMTMVGISGGAILLLVGCGHSLRNDVLGGSVGYSMLEWLTGGVLILMLYAYRSRPAQSSLRFLIFFADISYGLYLIHMLCGIWYDCLFGSRYLTNPGALLTRFVVVNAVAVLLATLSKRYFEDPIIRTRQRIAAAN